MKNKTNQELVQTIIFGSSSDKNAGAFALPSYSHLFYSDNETVLQTLIDVQNSKKKA